MITREIRVVSEDSTTVGVMEVDITKEEQAYLEKRFKKKIEEITNDEIAMVMKEFDEK